MIDPRSQQDTATPPRLRFNFTRAKEAGASDEQIIEFLRSKDTNIDWEALQERASKQQNPLTYQIATLAQNDWDFSPIAPTTTIQAPPPPQTPADTTQTQAVQSQPTTTLSLPQNQSEKFKELERENGLRGFWRQFAPEFLQSQNMQEDTKFLEQAKEQALATQTPYDKLPKALQDHIASKPQEQSLAQELASNLAPAAIAQKLITHNYKNELAKERYEKEQKALEIAQKEAVENLSDEDKEFIKQNASSWDKFWDSDEELYYDFIQTQRASKVVPKEMKHNLEVLNNIHGHKDIFTLAKMLAGGEENKELKRDYLDSAHNLATNLGFDGVGTNEKGELFISHEGKYYRVESGFWEALPTILASNTASLAGSLAGAAQGARYGRALGVGGAVAGTVLGGALGAASGGALDAIFANAYLNRETTAQEVIRHATQEGALNLVADGLVLGVVKLYSKAKNINPQTLKNLTTSAIEYTPVLGFIKRAKDGNKAAAQKLLAQTYTPEQEAALKKASDEFGLALQVGHHKKLSTQDLPDPLKNAIEKAQDIFTLQDQKQFQGKLLQSIRADESGNLLSFVAEAAAKSPHAHQNLSQILHQTTLKLKRELDNITTKASVKGIFDELEKGTKDSYEEAIVKILGDIYNDTYTINLNNLKEANNSKSFTSFKNELAQSGVAPETAANFLNFIEKNIYNDKGVNFTQLNNALKNLNSYYKQATDPNFKTHIKAAFDSFIRDDIKTGIDAIFAQNKTAYNDARALFDTALLDYANMKDTIKLADKLRLRDRANTEQKALKSLLDFAKGQGDKQSNIEAITKALPQHDRAHIEIHMLNELFSKATIEAKAVQVFDSAKFLNNVKELKGVFTSKTAQEYIAAASKFHELFKNDAQILQAIKPAVTEKIGSSIATSIEGAAKFQIVKAAFANIIRLMPHIPLMPQINQKVQGAALRHHLTNALESSFSISDLRFKLTQLEKRPSFNNATKELIAKFKGEIDNTRDEIIQAAKVPEPSHAPTAQAPTQEAPTPEPAPKPTEPTPPQSTNPTQAQAQATTPERGEPLAEFGTNYPEFYHDGKGAIVKLLAEKQGQVAGAFYRKELGDIDLIWGEVTDFDNHKGYGLAHILDKRKAEFMQQGLNEAQAQEKAIQLINNIPQIIESGKILKDEKGRLRIELDNQILGFKDNWHGKPTNKWIITSYHKEDMGSLYTSPIITKGETLPLNSSAIIPEKINETTPPIKNQLERAKQERQNKLEAAKKKELAEKELKEQRALALSQAIKENNDKIQAIKDTRAGKSEMERDIKIGQPIAFKPTNAPQTSVATDDNNIYSLDFVIVKAKDLQPNFTAQGLQPRVQREQQNIDEIARNFKPQMILGRGGYKDLPIIAKDGQVVVGNHRVQGFKDFTLGTSQETPKAAPIDQKKALELLESKQGERLPAELDIKQFLQNLEKLENKENFIKHMQSRDDAQSRIAYLHIVEPTLKHPDLELTKGERKTKIKVFNDGENFYSFLIADLDDKRLFTFLPKARKGYIESKIKNADLIHTFTSRASKDQEPNGLASEIIPQLKQSREAYEKAIKEYYGIELEPDELLLRMPAQDLEPKQLLAIAYNSNKEDIKNLSDHLYQVLGKYAPNFEKLPRMLESSSVQELKAKIAKILDPSPYPNENDANLALLAYTIKADKNANIAETLNNLNKLPKDDMQKMLQTFTDTAGLWHILSNNAVEYGLKNLDLRPFLLGAMQKAALSLKETRAQNFKELNEQIQHILDTTDKSGKNMMLEIMPNTYDNLIADILGASLSRFLRLENPSATLYETLKNARKDLEAQLQPKMDFFNGGFTQGKSVSEADIFDFLEYMIAQGERGKEVAKTIDLLPFLRERYNAFKGYDTQGAKDLSATNTLKTEPTPPTSTPPPKPTPAQKLESKESNHHAQREQTKAILESLINKPITNQNDGRVAQISRKNIAKMTSDKAVAKSVANGFEPAEHFKAVEQITQLFEKATKAATHTDPTDINLTIHRYNAPFENANALLTLKEYQQDGKRLYSLELENLEAIKFNPSSKDLMEQSSKSKDIDTANFNAPNENPSEIIPQIPKDNSDYAKLQSLRREQESLKARREELKAQAQATTPERGEPLAEFGTNYPEFYHDGKGAIKKLLAEKQGQVAGAFYRKELGDIDLIWGEVTDFDNHKGYGLAHILDKHGDDFKDIAKELSEIVEYGVVVKTHNGYNITLGDYKVGLNIGWNENGVKIGENKWVVTAFDNSKLQSEKQGSNSASFTKGETLPLNSSAIIPEKINETTPPIKNQLEQAKQERQNELEAAKKKELAENKLKEQRAQTKEMLKPYTHNKITNKNDNTQAVLTNKGIAEMLSSKAIAQSVNNGFTQAQHIKAVQNIKELFTEAIYKETQEPRHPKNDVLAYRIYNASFDNANAIISVQERKINDDVVYFMKLENLEPRANTRALTSTPSIETKVDNRAQRQSLPSLESAQDSTTKTFNQDDIKLEQAQLTPPQSTEPTQAPTKEAPTPERGEPLAEFGTNYPEFYHDGKGAIKKLLAEKQGQVAGAFYRKELGDIDLIWGDEKIGLQKIIEKHLNDFETFNGKTAYEKLENAINEIVENGKLISENGVNTIYLKKDNDIFLIGISKGWYNKGENKWIVTSYKKTKGKIPGEIKGDTANLSAYSDEFNPLLTSKDEPLNSSAIIPEKINETTPPIKNQLEQAQLTPPQSTEPTQAPTKEAPTPELEPKTDTFIDTKGKEHTITQEVKQQWLDTFNLKSLDEAYTPKLPKDLQEAIGKEIKLTKGSLYKIVEKGREQYIPQIKETLEKPDFALKDSDDILIIAKEIGDKQYFTSINLETKDYFISISNAPKKENILKNKVENGAKVVYQSPNAKSIFYTDTLLQEGKSPTNKIDTNIIPQAKPQMYNTLNQSLKDAYDFFKPQRK